MLSQLRIHSLTLNFILYISLASSFVLQVSAAAVALPRQSIKLGAILMLTGDQAVYGKALLEGIELATEEINASGGINGTQISLMVEDSQLSPKTAHSAATKFVNVDHVTAALNASFIETMANGKVFESAHIPVVSLWDSATEIEQIGDYVFGIGLWTPSSAKRAADFAVGDLGAKTAVVINLQAEWSETVAGLFEKDFAARGGKILKRISVIPSTADFRTPIQLMKSLKPDVIYCPLTENSSTLQPGYFHAAAGLLHQIPRILACSATPRQRSTTPSYTQFTDKILDRRYTSAPRIGERI